MKSLKTLLIPSAFICATAATSQAFMISITIENLAPTSPLGMSLTPVWFGFHDGSYNVFDLGTTPSAGLTRIAELGETPSLNDEFQAFAPTGVSHTQNNPGGPGAGMFTPGSKVTFSINVDPMDNRFMSFASMVIPSNDWFVANSNPMFAELFDGSGNFLGAQSWAIDRVYDAGTEVDSQTIGPAFVMGLDKTLGTAQNELISLVTPSMYDFFVGVTQSNGVMLGNGLTGDALLQITVIPEPSTVALIAGSLMFGMAMLRRRRARAVELA